MGTTQQNRMQDDQTKVNMMIAQFPIVLMAWSLLGILLGNERLHGRTNASGEDSSYAWAAAGMGMNWSLMLPSRKKLDDLETAEDWLQRSRVAFEKDEIETALKLHAKGLDLLRKALENEKEPPQRSRIEDFLRSEENKRIIYVFHGYKDLGKKHGKNYKPKWRDMQEASRLTPPQTLVDPDLGLSSDYWYLQLAYGFMQLSLAEYYLQEGKFSDAQWMIADAKPYLATAERTKPDEEKGIDFRSIMRAYDEVAQKIENRGIQQGTYVQNQGVLQEWIGRVTKVEGKKLSVRITYRSNKAPKGFIEGKDVTLLSDECIPIQGVSVDAALSRLRSKLK